MQDTLNSAIKHFGAALISYSLNIDEMSLMEIAIGAADISPEKRDLLTELTRRLEEERISCAIYDLPSSTVLLRLTEETSSGKRSLFNSWRLAAGGSLPDFTTGDQVIDAFAPIATEMYPLCIARRMEGPFGLIYLTHSLFDNTERPDFERAILGDPSLKRLVGIEERKGRQVKARVKLNTGQSGGIFITELQNSILSAAYIYARMKSGLDVEGFRVALMDIFRLLRDAVEGKPTKIPVWIGFVNIAVPREIIFPWGIVHPYGQPDSFEFVPGDNRPTRGGQHEAALGFVLETSRDYQIEIDYDYLDDSGETQWPASMKKADDALQRACEHTQLTFSLSIDRSPPVACNKTWTLVVDPLAMTVGLSGQMRSSVPIDYHVVQEHEIDTAQEWGDILHSTPSSKVDIALRRLITATTNRTNPVDGFIDAVVAWENLFAGTSQGELSFRICGAMSKLLEVDVEKRLLLHKELTGLYNSRSKVVHGSKELSVEDAAASRDQALDVLLRCLRTLYADYPELLSDPDRSRRIILTH
ncbi:HEPN domain-containing protein [Nonomuraea cavernae]|uniref:Apea-like HEPN domain-containing protein n=1 Tax=Nonomuraea cavernae TaxID=2045107 RepID=A0A918DFW8_9ACTN|nr:HEPN domain-containing protein [Nonomuraea cavernae]MCA2184200.1 hypothetical protein [Nonomuraea cavernae]GGO62614.1 hypothetical protein GCM10012289_07690 [Nonomuraea cavernae]